MNLTKVGKSSFKIGLLKNQSYCHSERSEESVAYATSRINREILRLTTQNDIIKTFFNGLKFVFLFLLILTTIGFFDLKKVKADDIETPSHEVIINELMWMGSNIAGDDEWIELKNMTQEKIPLDGWRITKNTGTETDINIIFQGKFIPADGYFLISYKNANDSVLAVSPDVQATTRLFLSDSKLKITLYDSNGKLVDVAGNGGTPLAGEYLSKVKWESMERNIIPGDGKIGANWDTATNSLNFDDGAEEKGTPDNSHNQSPNIPDLLLPNNNVLITQGMNIQFSWLPATDPENDDVFYSLFVGCSSAFDQNNLITVSNIGDNHYILNSKEIIDDIGICPVYYWAVKSSDGMSESILSPFRKLQVIYSKSIVVNELYPDPDSGESEWIELYNNSSEKIDLENWILEDEDGNRQTITTSLLISPFGFVVINSKISLNNDGDLIKLFDPNGKLVSSTPKYLDGDEGWSYVRGPTGKWSWTTTPTVGKINIISLPKVDDPVQETELVINTVPIEISTGDYQNYLDKLVKIRGKVISTSGNTFYIDDGSGVIKVYIQEKTGIEKPEMHRNDIFEIIGVVDLYGQTWRILPRILSDIALIEKSPVVTKTTATKKVVSKVVTAVKSPLISKAVAAASTSPPTENTDKLSTLNQIVKTSLGLAVMLLVFLIFKLWHQPKTKTIGGHFGDDET